MARTPKHPSKRRYVLTHMFEKHHEMARLIFLGYGNKEIAAALNVTPQNVSDCRNSPIMQQKVELLRTNRDEAAIDVSAALKEDAPENLRLLQQIRDDAETTAKLKVHIARDLLDRAGHGKVTKVEGTHVHGHILRDTSQIEEIKRRAKEARSNKAETAEVTDAEIVEEAAG